MVVKRVIWVSNVAIFWNKSIVGAKLRIFYLVWLINKTYASNVKSNLLNGNGKYFEFLGEYSISITKRLRLLTDTGLCRYQYLSIDTPARVCLLTDTILFLTDTILLLTDTILLLTDTILLLTDPVLLMTGMRAVRFNIRLNTPAWV